MAMSAVFRTGPPGGGGRGGTGSGWPRCAARSRAVAGFAAGYAQAGSLLAAAALATICEAIGFYGCIAAKTGAAARRATAHLGGWRRLAAGAWHAVREQLASCAVAETVDGFLIRPGCLAVRGLAAAAAAGRGVARVRGGQGRRRRGLVHPRPPSHAPRHSYGTRRLAMDWGTKSSGAQGDPEHRRRTQKNPGKPEARRAGAARTAPRRTDLPSAEIPDRAPGTSRAPAPGGPPRTWRSIRPVRPALQRAGRRAARGGGLLRGQGQSRSRPPARRHAAGCRFEAASWTEVRAAVKAGADPGTVLYDQPGQARRRHRQGLASRSMAVRRGQRCRTAQDRRGTPRCRGAAAAGSVVSWGYRRHRW